MLLSLIALWQLAPALTLIHLDKEYEQVTWGKVLDPQKVLSLIPDSVYARMVSGSLFLLSFSYIVLKGEGKDQISEITSEKCLPHSGVRTVIGSYCGL